jgi:proteasome lid subunit RPN8/RPN11
VQVDEALVAEMVAHAREDYRDECCGLVAKRDGVAVEVRRMENLAHTWLKFEMDGLKVLGALDDFEAAGAELGAIYHSHTKTPPYPSQTDINFAAGWPGVEWIIIGLQSRDAEPIVRTYLIEDGNVREV